MKKLVMFMGLVSAALVLGAQDFNPALYEDSSLSGFEGRRFRLSEEDAGKFKIPAIYLSGEDGSLLFTDSGRQGSLELETEIPWPALRDGQSVTLYISAYGPWVWDRQLDAIDYGGNRLVRADAEGTGVWEAPSSGGGSAPDNRPVVSGGSGSGRTGDRTGIPAANPTVDEIASSREVSPGFDYGRVPLPGTPRRVVVQISGKAPVQGRRYRLQVGSFSIQGNAVRASDKLRELGLNPAFERHENNLRVVLPRVPGEDVIDTAKKLGVAGFTEIWCQEEP
ncbi:MAG: hypothetical protein LBQ46_00835 [Treponema sp.]|jgi:hypothetical protein|nr:hypothetical protein [Treponema sp.]